jgi:hypothetical protein
LTVPFNVEFGKTPRHDTDDTNRGFGDTRTIQWTVKMARSEIFQMSLIGRPNDARCQDGGTRLWSLLRRKRELWEQHLSRKPTTGSARSALVHPST